MMLVVILAISFSLSQSHTHIENDGLEHHHPHPVLHPSYKNCPVSRANVTRELQIIDANGDKKFSPCEILEGKEDILSTFQRFLAWFYSIEKIMCDCDWDRDGYISEHDMIMNSETCLVTCEKAILLDAVIIQPAKNMNYKPRRHSECTLNPEDYICKDDEKK